MSRWHNCSRIIQPGGIIRVASGHVCLLAFRGPLSAGSEDKPLGILPGPSDNCPQAGTRRHHTSSQKKQFQTCLATALPLGEFTGLEDHAENWNSPFPYRWHVHSLKDPLERFPLTNAASCPGVKIPASTYTRGQTCAFEMLVFPTRTIKLSSNLGVSLTQDFTRSPTPVDRHHWWFIQLIDFFKSLNALLGFLIQNLRVLCLYSSVGTQNSLKTAKFSR